MTKTAWYTLWGGAFILCAGLGFIPGPDGFMKFLMTVLSIAFFAPPAMLLRTAHREKDALTLRLIRNLSAVSLLLTAAVLIGNFLSLMAPEALGNFLYVLLVIVSTPMVCSQYWVLSLFLWACLLMVSMQLLNRKR